MKSGKLIFIATAAIAIALFAVGCYQQAHAQSAPSGPPAVVTLTAPEIGEVARANQSIKDRQSEWDTVLNDAMNVPIHCDAAIQILARMQTANANLARVKAEGSTMMIRQLSNHGLPLDAYKYSDDLKSFILKPKPQSS